MEVKKVNYFKANHLKIDFEIKNPSDILTTITSEKYLCGAVYFQIQAMRTVRKHNMRDFNTCMIDVTCCTNMNVKFEKVLEKDDIIYKCHLTSERFIKKDAFSADGTWNKVFSWYQMSNDFSFDVDIQVEVSSTANPLAPLYQDTELTDFELRAEDGSVPVHSLILAVNSPYFKTIFTGKWKETSEGHVNVTGANKEILEQFKAYIYLNELPETNTRELLLLGSYYMMPELVQECSIKLIHTLNSENPLDLIEFALKYKLTILMEGILNAVKNGIISIEKVSTWFQSK